MIEKGAHINFESPLSNLSRRDFIGGGAAGCAGWIAGIAIPYLPIASYASSSTSGDTEIGDNSQQRMEKTIEIIRQGQEEGWHLGACSGICIHRRFQSVFRILPLVKSARDDLSTGRLDSLDPLRS